MKNQNAHWAETAALIYIVSPVFIFFAYFVRVSAAVPACLIIAICFIKLIRITKWESILSPSRRTLYALALAVVWSSLAGSFGLLYQNSDWIKHYSILNYLATHHWPMSIKVDGLNGEWGIRYSIGWYLAPSLVLKYTNLHAQKIVSGVWSTIGTFLFFRMLMDLMTKKRAAIIAPIVFMLFGGADFIGTAITHFHIDLIYHIQWWSGWIEYGATMTSMFWVPQHAIPSWIGIALLMRQAQRPTVLPYIALFFSAASLWSPFAVIGLAPFALILVWQYGLRPIAFGWRQIAALIFIAFPVFLYLTSGGDDIPHGFIASGAMRHVFLTGPWFSWLGYIRFILLEFAIPSAILLFTKQYRNPFVMVATLSLIIIPLYRIGAYNDFAMRSSIVGLAVIAIYSGELIATGPCIPAIALSVALACGLPTSLGEVLRGFALPQDVNVESNLESSLKQRPEVLSQYFARLPIPLLKNPDIAPTDPSRRAVTARP